MGHKINGYSIYSEFDLKKHKERFVDYLEVMILSDGTVQYAIPSHVYMAERLAAKAMGTIVEEIRAMCPAEYYWDYLPWLLGISGAVAVWNCRCEYKTVTKEQIAMLRRMKMAGVYRGEIPVLCRKKNGNDKFTEKS